MIAVSFLCGDGNWYKKYVYNKCMKSLETVGIEDIAKSKKRRGVVGFKVEKAAPVLFYVLISSDIASESESTTKEHKYAVIIPRFAVKSDLQEKRDVSTSGRNSDC